MLRKQISFPCQKRRMCYLIRSGEGMREELLPWRKTSYCRCHELECSAICLQFQMKTTFEYLPPTKAALVEHIKRTTRIAGYVWGQSIISKQVLPSPNLWGWVKSETGWVPFWTPLPRAAKAMNVLISCGCTTWCTGSCSCYKKGFVCTAICKCSGHCHGRSNHPPTSPSN